MTYIDHATETGVLQTAQKVPAFHVKKVRHTVG